ncbi:MAG: TetR/AcrR family transcriptional regulator [Tissierellaceae bacterium]
MDYEMGKYTKKKKEIVDIIVNLMDEDGLKNITIKEICEATNISIGAFYHYFKSKDSIADDMYCLMDEFFMVNKSTIKNHLSTAEKVIDFVNHFGMYVEEWGFYANLFIMRSSIQNTTKKIYKSKREIYKILEEIIQEGIEKGDFRVEIEPSELTTMIFVIIRGYLLEWIKREENYPVKENMVKHATYLMNYLKA